MPATASEAPATTAFKMAGSLINIKIILMSSTLFGSLKNKDRHTLKMNTKIKIKNIKTCPFFKFPKR